MRFGSNASPVNVAAILADRSRRFLLTTGMTEASMQQHGVQWPGLYWEKDPPAAEWDRALAQLGGHPLQSCLWGDARRSVDGIVQHRWLAHRNGEPVWMIRVEERRVPSGKIAWAPRGPTGGTAQTSLSVPPGLEERLRTEGFSLLICDPWVRVEGTRTNGFDMGGRTRPRTIWLDLTLGKDILFTNLHKQARKGVRRAARGGVFIETAHDPRRIGEFVDLCSSVSVRKGFDLRVTTPLIDALLNDPRDRKDVDATLWISLKEARLGAGLLILRAGRNVHQMAGGTDRDLRQARVGEACQWGVIEWAIARGCTRYDLEGIDPINNRTVYEFKRRLGGEEVTLRGHVHRPLTFSGRAMSWLIRRSAYGYVR